MSKKTKPARPIGLLASNGKNHRVFGLRIAGLVKLPRKAAKKSR